MVYRDVVGDVSLVDDRIVRHQHCRQVLVDAAVRVGVVLWHAAPADLVDQQLAVFSYFLRSDFSQLCRRDAFVSCEGPGCGPSRV